MDKTFAAIEKLKAVELELHRLKNALEMINCSYDAKKEWVGLTDEEYEEMAEQYVTNCYFDTLEYAKNIEAKLKEKNT